MGRLDTIRNLVLDRSEDDMSGADDFAAARMDSAALTQIIDCEISDEIDVIVDIKSLGFGPASRCFIVGRVSSKANPSIDEPGDWSTINIESLDTTTGQSVVRPYQPGVVLTGTGCVSLTFPCRERYFSAVVWVDQGNACRGVVYFYRRED